MPVNPYKDQSGDGVHIERDLLANPGEFAQRSASGQIVAVPAGTEGQVPTYQEDGTLAPADSSGGGGGGSAVESVFIAAQDTLSVGAGTLLEWSSSFDITSTGDVELDGTDIAIQTPGIYHFDCSVGLTNSAAGTPNGRYIAFSANDANIPSQITGGMQHFYPFAGLDSWRTTQVLVFQETDIYPITVQVAVAQDSGGNINGANASITVTKLS